MAEVGIDLAGRKPQKLLCEMQLHADWAVTMGCGDACPYVPTTVEAWDIPIRPDVRSRRSARSATSSKSTCGRSSTPGSDAIRSARTAHQLRLAQLLPSLATQFEQDHDAEEIRACADAILGRYDDAPVRSFVQALALRQTRDCLRREHCDALAVS